MSIGSFQEGAVSWDGVLVSVRELVSRMRVRSAYLHDLEVSAFSDRHIDT